jgi:hypothetical protein
MTVRLILGVLAIAGVSTCGLLATLTHYEIADKVNENLPEMGQFGWLGWCRLKSGRFEREYKRLYPSGRLLRKMRILCVLALISLLIGAWAFGFFSTL